MSRRVARSTMDPSHPARAPAGPPPRHCAPAARAWALLGCVALAACSFGGAAADGQERANAATVAACRQRAEQVYDMQQPGGDLQPAAGDQHAVLRRLRTRRRAPSAAWRICTRATGWCRDCIRNTGTQTDRGRPPNPTNAP